MSDRLSDKRLGELSNLNEPISHAEVLALLFEVRASRAGGPAPDASRVTAPPETRPPTLREAAQALCNAWFGDDGSGEAAVNDAHFDALRAALSATARETRGEWRFVADEHGGHMLSATGDKWYPEGRDPVSRREGIEEAARILIGMWDDGDQGPPRSEIEQYAEIVLLRALAVEGRHG